MQQGLTTRFLTPFGMTFLLTKFNSFVQRIISCPVLLILPKMINQRLLNRIDDPIRFL
jgi:hypothetical protein